MRIVWTEPALDAIAQAYDYVAQEDLKSARRVAQGLLDAGNSLIDFPRRGRVVSGTEMRELVAAFSYVIQYRLLNDELVILRVRHGARRPTDR